MNVSIRHAKVKDAKVLALAEREIAKIPGQLVSLPRELTLERFEKTISALLKSKKGVYLVAEVDNEIVGHGFLEPLHLNAISHVADLTLAVHEGWQGKGVGSLLLEELIKWAHKSKNIEKIELQVRASNRRAISLYKKMGFMVEGRRKKRVKIKRGLYVDDILMALDTL